MNGSDMELLRLYAREKSETAFAELVRQHAGLVYSAALRQMAGDAHLAEDVTQLVFAALARQASGLTRHTSLTGWLYTSTRYVAAAMRRAAQRRCAREQEARIMSELSQDDETGRAWEQLRPVLDEAMHDLRAGDREAVLLRFFERLPFATMGARLGLTEDAARQRVARALEKLRAALASRGITSTAAALGGMLTAQAVEVTPAGLAASVSSAAVANTVGASVNRGFQARLLSPAGSKVVVGGAVLVALLALFSIQLRTGSTPGPAASDSLQAPAHAGASPRTGGALSPNSTQPVATNMPAEASNTLHLEIVAADSGKPVPNVTVLYDWQQHGGYTSRTVSANRKGICNLLFPQGVQTLELWTDSDGFASTEMCWQPDRGLMVPPNYTLRLTRPVPIGGQVLDADGQPVAGASVVFRLADVTCGTDRLAVQPEAHSFPRLHTTTDRNGHWSINRIAPELVRRLHGVATHPGHLSAEVSASGHPEDEQQLRADSYVFHLRRPVVIHGRVIDTEGRPVSKASILAGVRYLTGARSTTSSRSGAFEVSCEPGKSLLTAESEGFASTTLVIDSSNPGPFTLTLQRPKTLRLRVVDQDGKALANKSLAVTLRYGPEAVRRLLPDGRPLAWWYTRTDTEGCAAWTNAPDDALSLNAWADSYQTPAEATVWPDEQEHLLMLQPAPPPVTLAGTVRDAATGELIPFPHLVRRTPCRCFHECAPGPVELVAGLRPRAIPPLALRSPNWIRPQV